METRKNAAEANERSNMFNLQFLSIFSIYEKQLQEHQIYKTLDPST